MRLYYCKSFDYNFGDDLNPWLWSKLIPEVFQDDDANTLFVGIGTILNDEIPAGARKIVFGSGTGYGTIPALDESWHFVCVRGPLTAKALGVDPGLAITDAAALARTVYQPRSQRSGGYVAFMPHHVSALRANWRRIAEDAGLVYIEPRQPVNRVLDLISGASQLIAEAMHGAIIADALRVQWTPVSCYGHINDFKWRDWCESLDLQYRPTMVPSVIESFASRPAEFVRHLRSVRRAGYWERWPRLPAAAQPTDSSVRAEAVKHLKLAASGPRYLSRDVVIETATERLVHALEQVRDLVARSPSGI